MKKWYSPVALLVILLLSTAMTSDKSAYKVYNLKGRAANYSDILKAASKADIIFFGELHNNPICHWLELELAKDLYNEKGAKLVLGAEMLEADNQLLLDEYLSKLIRKKDFESEAKLWSNYKTDYAPLVDFAREKHIKFVATSIPRRFAALVNLKGFEGLDSINARERALIAPLPIHYPDTLECYKSIGKAVGDGMAPHMTNNLAKAQAIKDATMAHFIQKNGVVDETTFLHFNGSYHSDNFQGIVWYINDNLKKTNYNLKIMTISCVEQANIDTIAKSDVGKADFIIVIPSSMPKSH